MLCCVRGAGKSLPEPVTLYPQSQPVCATEPRFCLPYNVQLTFSRSDEDYVVTDAYNTNIIYFKCEDNYALVVPSKKILRDFMGAPVLNVRRKFFR